MVREGTRARSAKRRSASVRDEKPVSYTHLRAHETDSYLVCRLLLEKKKTRTKKKKKHNTYLLYTSNTVN